jgi:hypothetical protein
VRARVCAAPTDGHIHRFSLLSPHSSVCALVCAPPRPTVTFIASLSSLLTQVCARSCVRRPDRRSHSSPLSPLSSLKCVRARVCAAPTDGHIHRLSLLSPHSSVCALVCVPPRPTVTFIAQYSTVKSVVVLVGLCTSCATPSTCTTSTEGAEHDANHDTLRTPCHSCDPNDVDYMAVDAKQHDTHPLRSPVRSRGHCIAGTEQTRNSQTTLPQTSACLRYQVSERVRVIRHTPSEPPCACVHDCDHLGVSMCGKVLTDSAD